MKCDSILFDLDGTLWLTTHAAQAAWGAVYAANPTVSHPKVTEGLVASLMGKPASQIAKTMLPAENKVNRARLFAAYQANLRAYLAEHGGTLFTDQSAVLNELAKKYKLAVVSNCQAEYLTNFFKLTGFQKYFCDFECAGQTGQPKANNIRLVQMRNGFEHSVYVGDSIVDYEACQTARVPLVYAAYGCGKVPAYAFKIKRFADLRDLPLEVPVTA